MEDIRNFFANRIGGKDFDKESGYKFATIKSIKEDFCKKNPDVKLLDFGVGEPDSAADECVIRALQNECGKLCNRFYADSGTFYFLNAVADYMRSYFSVELNPANEILHSVGTKSALSILAGCLINEGDIVLSTQPGYPVFDINAKYFGAKVLALPLLEENNFFPNFDALTASELNSIKILSINYPNNPTGASASIEFFEKVIFFAKKYNWIIINDAAYASLVFDEKPLSIMQINGAKNVAIELHSMSKSFNMTGWRLGWVCSNELLINAYKKYKDTVNSGQFLAIQKAAIEALKNHQPILQKNIQKYRRRANAVVDVLKKAGFLAKMPSAGFFIYVSTPQEITLKSGHTITFKTAKEFSEWLLSSCGIVCIPWDEAGRFLRFSITFEANTIPEENAIINELENRLNSNIYKI